MAPHDLVGAALARVEGKLDRLSSTIADVREKLVTDHGALAARVSVLESDNRRLWGIVGLLGTLTAGAIASALAQMFGGAA